MKEFFKKFASKEAVFVSIVVFFFMASFLAGSYGLIKFGKDILPFFNHWVNIYTITGTVIFVFFMFIGAPLIQRYWLADNYIIWGRIPEMSAAFVMRDNVLYQIKIACSDNTTKAIITEAILGEARFKTFLESCATVMNLDGRALEAFQSLKAELDEENVEFISDNALFWIGFPWRGYSIHKWYDKSRDDDDPNTYPNYFLDLRERTWDFFNPNDFISNIMGREITDWGVDTADPVQVVPKMVAVVQSVVPYKTVFGVVYYQEAILKEFLAAWKYCVQNLRYFHYEKEKDNKVSGVNDNLQTQAQINFWDFLGLKYEWVDRAINDKGDTTKVIELLETHPGNYEKGKPARKIYEDYGVWLKRAYIRDIDPSDPKIRENLQKKLIAQTDAQAQLEKAKGQRDSTRVIADGKAYDVDTVGNAEARIIEAKFAAKGKGLKSIAAELKLSDGEQKLVLMTEQSIEALQNSKYAYLSGGGSISEMGLQFLDRASEAFEKVKSGDGNQKKVGINDIKLAWGELSDDEKQEIKNLVDGQ